jgi:hypothetical protein
MKTDIFQKIEKDFGTDFNLALEQVEMLEVLTKGLISDRMLRAMVFLAKGDIDRFTEVIELGRTNNREVLQQAEYDGADKKVYDFNQSFHALKLMDK